MKYLFLSIILVITINHVGLSQTSPEKINFVRQGVQRMIFDEDQSISLARLEPQKIVGLSVMHPAKHYSNEQANILINNDKLVIQSKEDTQTAIWFGGFNPFATYSIDLDSCIGNGEIGFEFSDANKKEQFFVTIGFNNSRLTTTKLRVLKNFNVIEDKSIAVNL